ncbi:HAMP domain-containing protein (plasmid) [Methylobacterium oryzae CBMB20]
MLRVVVGGFSLPPAVQNSCRVGPSASTLKVCPNDADHVAVGAEAPPEEVSAPFRKGDFSTRLPLDLTGIDGEIAEAFNDIVELNQGLARELDKVARAVGKDGRINERGKLPAATGGWNDCVDSVNTMIGDLVQPTTEVARVIGAVAKGDLGQTMQLEIEGRPLRGEFLRIGKVVNTMVDQLNSFASEVTRVARGGRLGGQARRSSPGQGCRRHLEGISRTT